jgi:hypothetical protein
LEVAHGFAVTDFLVAVAIIVGNNFHFYLAVSEKSEEGLFAPGTWGFAIWGRDVVELDGMAEICLDFYVLNAVCGSDEFGSGRWRAK